MDSNSNYKYGIKSTFSQCLALVGAGFLQVGVGTELICSTVIIGALSDHSNENERLTMTNEQTSWFGSLLYLCTPLGSLISSLVLGRLGHKNCMIITNIPYLVSQIMFFYAENVETMYACSIIMGLSVGFSGGPFSAYIGEVCEPKLRGALMSATNVFFFSGSLLFATIYAITRQWRLTVLINMAIPIITIAILCMSPDSPMWLLSKGKNEKAQRTLGKLRGWVTHDKCADEFHEMVVFMSANKSSSNDKNGKNDSESSWKQLLQPDVLKPFRLLLIYFFFSNLLSGVPFAPYLVEVFRTFGADVDVQWTVAFSLCIAIVAGILTVLLVNRLGKRFLTLSTLSICSICYISIGLIGVYWTSSEQIKSWLLLTCFLISTFVASFGIMPIGWILLTEIFPMKSRNITCSICSTLSFIISFFMTKYYPDVVDLVDFYNTFTIFGIGGLIGCVYFYFCLPETLFKLSVWKASFYNKLYPQIGTIIVQNVIMLGFGMSLAIPTVVIGSLMSDEVDGGGGDTMTLTETEASWYGSVLLVCHPTGGLLSGVLQEIVGRKWCMALVSVPQLVGWYVLWRAGNAFDLYVSCVALGLSMGLSEAPVLTYVGETVEPRLRGPLSSVSTFTIMLGSFVAYLMSTVMPWRTVAMINMAVPVISFAAVVLLRGCVSTADVEDEFSELSIYAGFNKSVDLEQYADCGMDQRRLSYVKYLQINTNDTILFLLSSSLTAGWLLQDLLIPIDLKLLL